MLAAQAQARRGHPASRTRGATMDEARYREAERRLWDDIGLPARERFLALPRLGVEVRVQEVGHGDPVLFIHGASNGGTSWARLTASLPGVRRCVLLDRPGCGLSQPLPRQLDSDGIVEVARHLVPDVLDAMEVDRAAVVATSFGSLSALHGAAAHADRLSRVVLLAWPVGAPTAHVPSIMRMGALRPMSAMMARMPVTTASVRSMLRQIGLRRALETGRFTDLDLDVFVALLRHTDTFHNEVNGGRYLSLRHGVVGGLVVPDEVLASITAPVLMLWGDEDPLGGPDVAHDLAARIPTATLKMLPAAGHAPWIDHPEHVAAAITKFLEPDGAVAGWGAAESPGVGP
jgi:pimeloyl-ACP methyl ester carboxylesterase